MADEVIYNVPLRSEWLKVPRWRRSKKAVKALREFISKHTKSDNVKIGKYLNLRMWEHGAKNPPGKITVKVIKDKDKVIVELPGIEIPKEEPKKEVKEDKKELTKEEKEKKKILEHPPEQKHKKEEMKQKETRPEIDEKIREEGIIGKTQRKDVIK
ncbi:MAG: 50S ribosomal protein L31e [Candidatus Woesearchaeota archaeon]|nr:MAG: 50S ribosomal protein L31e [Candidatus Woesearchaeota archaeon]